MKRRAFLPFLLTPTFINPQRPVVEDGKSAPPTKITRIDTTYWRDGASLPWKPNWVWVRVYTDSGLVGLGETYPRHEAEASVMHSSIADMLLLSSRKPINTNGN